MAKVVENVQLTIAKKSIDDGIKREIIRILTDHRNTVIRKATIPERAVVYVEPDADVLNYAYARYDNFVDYFMGQEF